MIENEINKNEILINFVREKERFNLDTREKVMWIMVKHKYTWMLYFYLKADALARLIFKKS